jgi:PAS domain S-box-containing protein
MTQLIVPLMLAVVAGLLAGLAIGAWRTRRPQQQDIDALPTGVCAISDRRVQQWNREMSRLSGLPREQALGRSLEELPEPWSTALDGALLSQAGRVHKQALDAPTDDGPRWVMLHSSPSASTPGGRLVMVEDITEFQKLQDELLHKERLASVGRLAAGVAHEIGNPVTGIACVAQNLREDAQLEEVDQAAAEIIKQTERISRTLSSLMQLTHPGSTDHEVQCEPCNVADCIDEAIHLLRLDRRAQDCHFDNRSDRQLLARADAQLFLQVLLNLLDNARAAGAPGPVIIDSRGEREQIVLTVDNPGARIPAATLQKVFDPFFTTKDVGEGTGLGLSLVRRMLEDMDGAIELSSPSPAFGDEGVRATLTLCRDSYDPAFTDGLTPQMVSSGSSKEARATHAQGSDRRG